MRREENADNLVKANKQSINENCCKSNSTGVVVTRRKFASKKIFFWAAIFVGNYLFENIKTVSDENERK